jgi:hypothetical protein
VKPGEVWRVGLPSDERPWFYLVTEADDDGVDLVLLDAAGEPDVDPGDQIALSWDDVEAATDRDTGGELVWERVA